MLAAPLPPSKHQLSCCLPWLVELFGAGGWTVQGKPVVAAIMRVFGPQLAELPLIATKLTARRQGHARVLLKVGFCSAPHGLLCWTVCRVILELCRQRQ